MIASLVVVSILCGARPADAQTTVSAAKVPLWQLPPFDRLHLTDGTGYDIEAVRIPAGTPFEAKPDEYIGRPGLPTIKDLVNEKRAAIYHVQRVDDGQTYEVVGRSIKSIEYYEDLLIAEAMKLVSPARKFDEALEYLKAVAARDPNWPGFLEARLRFHRAEAEQQAGRGMLGEAFLTLIEERRLFIELKGKATQPLDDERWEGRFNSLINRWVDQLYRVENRYDDARRAISRAEIAYPECQAAAEWRRRYGERTNQLVAQANQQKQAGDLKSAFESLAEAMEVDPQAPNVKSAVEALYTDYPVLRVAVGRLPMYESGPAEWSPADVRAADLIHIPIMWMESAQDGGVYASHLIDQPERPNEFVNQRAILTLKEGEFKWPGDNKPVTVIDIERLLASYCQPGPLYHPAFEPLMEGFTPLLPNRLQIDFFRPQFQPAIWLQGPFFRMSPDPSVPQSVARFMPALSGLGPYRLDQSRRGGAVAYTHNPVYLHKGKPIIKQVVERRYPTSAHRLRALKNGDVHMIDYVPPRHHAHVKNMAGTKLLRMARPRVHVLQFNYNRRELRDRTVRRAIAYAINRETVFQRVGIPIDNDNRLLTVPLPSGTFGANEELAQREYYPVLSKVLIAAVKQELKSISPMTLAHSGDETSKMACHHIATDLRLVGLDVKMVELDEESTLRPLNADMRYMAYYVTDPIYDLVTMLTRDNPSLADYASPWLRESLVDLLQVPNVTEARNILPELQRVLYEDVAIVPLWQWYDFFAVHETVTGLPAAQKTLYDSVADWKVAPRFPPSNWEKLPTAAAGGE